MVAVDARPSPLARPRVWRTRDERPRQPGPGPHVADLAPRRPSAGAQVDHPVGGPDELGQVLDNPKHAYAATGGKPVGEAMGAAERADLVAFLKTISRGTEPFGAN